MKTKEELTELAKDFVTLTTVDKMNIGFKLRVIQTADMALPEISLEEKIFIEASQRNLLDDLTILIVKAKSR